MKMKNSVCLGLLMSCLITGNVVYADNVLTGDQQLNTSLTNGNYTVDGEKASVTNTNGNVLNGGSITLKDGQELTLTANGGDGVISDTTIKSDGTVNLINNNGNGLGSGNNTIIADVVNVTAHGNKTKGITGSGNTTINAEKITIESDSDAIHISGNDSNSINLKGFSELTLHGGKGSEGGYAIQIASGQSLVIEGNEYSKISMISDNMSAIRIQDNENASVSISGGNINIKNNSNTPTIDVTNGKLDITANDKLVITNTNTEPLKYHNAIRVENGSTFDLHTKDDTVVQITGNVVLDKNSSVSLNLNGKDSFIDGGIYNSNFKTNNVQLSLNNGAVWNNNYTGSVFKYTSSVASLKMDGGIIKQSENTGITINNFEGNGDIYFKAEVTDDNALDLNNNGKINIKAAAENSNISVGIFGAEGIDTQNQEKLEATLNAIAGQVVYEGEKDKLTGKVEVAEGIITSSVSADINFDETGDNSGAVDIGSIQVGDKETATMKNMRDIASVALVAWRQEDSTLSQRLGELRNSEGDQGIWARMSRGEFEYDGAFKNQYNYFQLGYDWADKDWHYGAAISHNDGQTTYAQGSGENDSTSLTLYGTWLGDKGQYTDIVVKQGKLNNEFTNYADAGVTSADYDMWGTSISAEYGQKLEMKNDWYVTPQAQLTYMRIGGEDYTASVATADGNKAMQVSQDGMDSFVGRIGFEAGKNISEKGSIYAKASLLHEFAGEADTFMQMGTNVNSYSQDLGDTWYECGFGVNYKTSDSSYVYADVVKTFGGDVETPWQWNAGMRWSF